MSAGVAVVFRHKFGRPQHSDFVDSNLTCQRVPNGATVYSLVTKPVYNGKPTQEEYEKSFAQLTRDFERKGLRTLVCSPMGCVRDQIMLDCFFKNVTDFQSATKAKVVIVLYKEVSGGVLRRGLSHAEFLKDLKQLSIKHNEKLMQQQSVDLPLESSEDTAFASSSPFSLDEPSVSKSILPAFWNLDSNSCPSTPTAVVPGATTMSLLSPQQKNCMINQSVHVT